MTRTVASQRRRVPRPRRGEPLAPPAHPTPVPPRRRGSRRGRGRRRPGRSARRPGRARRRRPSASRPAAPPVPDDAVATVEWVVLGRPQPARSASCHRLPPGADRAALPGLPRPARARRQRAVVAATPATAASWATRGRAGCRRSGWSASTAATTTGTRTAADDDPLRMLLEELPGWLRAAGLAHPARDRRPARRAGVGHGHLDGRRRRADLRPRADAAAPAGARGVGGQPRPVHRLARRLAAPVRGTARLGGQRPAALLPRARGRAHRRVVRRPRPVRRRHPPLHRARPARGRGGEPGTPRRRLLRARAAGRWRRSSAATPATASRRRGRAAAWADRALGPVRPTCRGAPGARAGAGRSSGSRSP